MTTASLSRGLGTQRSLRSMAELLKAQGRHQDKILAHINPREAKMLKRAGGSGAINPKTGIMEFDDFFDFFGTGDVGAPSFDPAPEAPIPSLPSDIPTDNPLPTADPSAGGVDPSSALAPGNQLPSASDEIGSAKVTDAVQKAGIANSTPSSGGGFFDKLTNFISQPENALKAGLGVGGLGLGLYNASQAQAQGKQVQQQISAIPNNLQQLSQQTQQQLQDLSNKYASMVQQSADALRSMSEPVMQQFTALTQLTNQGKLSPANQQVMDAARARLEQDAANRGGVGVQQAQGQLDRLYNTLLASQMTQALQMYQAAVPGQTAAIQTQLQGQNAANSYLINGMQTALSTTGIADQYALQAIQTGLQNDAQARQSMQNFYGSLAQILAGTPIKSA